MPVSFKLIDRDVVFMQHVFEKEVLEVLQCINGLATPFLVVDRWMEVIGFPPCPSWIKFSGVPLHAWSEEVFRLLGNWLRKSNDSMLMELIPCHSKAGG